MKAIAATFFVLLILGGPFLQCAAKEIRKDRQESIPPKERFMNGVLLAMRQLGKDGKLGDFLDSVEKHISPLSLDVEGGGFELGGAGELTYSSSKVPGLRIVVHTKLGGRGGADQADVVTSIVMQSRIQDPGCGFVWQRIGASWAEGKICDREQEEGKADGQKAPMPPG